MNSFSMSSIGINTHDQLILQLVSSLFQNTNGNDWHYMENDTNAQILFLDVDNASAPVKNNIANADQIHIPLYSKNQPTNHKISLVKPLRVSEVRRLLVSITNQKELPQLTPPSLVANTSCPFLNALIPQHTQQPIEIQANQHPKILLSRSENALFIEGTLKDIASYKNICNAPLQTRVLNPAQWKAATNHNNLTKIPLDQAL